MEEVNFQGLPKLLHLSSQIEDLKIEYRRVDRGLLRLVDLHERRLLQRVVESESLPKLKRLELRNIPTKTEHLMALVQRTSVRRLFLHRIMQTPSAGPLFEYYTSDAAGIEEFDFYRLTDRNGGGG